jgi:hypothetical protein
MREVPAKNSDRDRTRNEFVLSCPASFLLSSTFSFFSAFFAEGCARLAQVLDQFIAEAFNVFEVVPAADRPMLNDSLRPFAAETAYLFQFL